MADTTATHLHTGTRYGGGMNLRALAIGNQATSTAWGTANLALYLPFSLPYSYTVNRLCYAVGATANGNVTMGIYGEATRALQASVAATAQGTINTIQYLSLASPLTLAAGDYFVAIALSSATGTVLAASLATPGYGRTWGGYQQAASIPLPATATFAAFAATPWPLLGMTRTSSGY